MKLEAAIREIAAEVIDARLAELNPPMLALDQVAERLSTSTATVRRLIAARKLKAVDVGSGGERGNRRVRREELERFIREGERL